MLTRVSLGNHFETLYAASWKTDVLTTASEVVRAGLRLLEENGSTDNWIIDCPMGQYMKTP
ncbi:MAG: type II toxin-antitoxin system ParD family antitoxin [Azoarcus sp.]|jgi:Arc/MetJ-type ribon-helix-helix transcriptional regulator|nr:type II toxin-antitoxin system ParD family antitoxin [Azoarcus sp.]